MKSYKFQITQTGGHLTSYEELDPTKADPVLNTKDHELSEININYLSKIVSFCKGKNVELRLVRSPLYQAHLQTSNVPYFQKIRKNRFSETEFMDLKDLLTHSSNFKDCCHLNSQGALNLSEYFRDYINSRTN